MRNPNPYKLTLILFCFTILFCGCNDFGEKIVVDGTEIYFDGEKVTQADAEKLSQFLKGEEFIDGDEKSVQLKRDGEKMIFRMVLQPQYLTTSELDRDFELMCLQLSTVFDGREVEFHACDEQFDLKKKLTGLRGELVDFGNAKLYFHAVTDEQLDSVKVVLEKLGFKEFDGGIHVGSDKDSFEVRMGFNEDYQKDDEIQRETAIWQEEFSKALDGSKVAVMICDEYLEPVFTREAVKTAQAIQ